MPEEIIPARRANERFSDWYFRAFVLPREVPITFITLENEEDEMTRTRTTPVRARPPFLSAHRVLQPASPEVAPPVPQRPFIADTIPGYSTYNLEALSNIHPVLNEYAAILRRDIYFCNTHGELKAPYLGDALHIYFWSRPSHDFSDRFETGHAYGYELTAGQRDTVIPSLEDQELGEMLHDTEGHPVALVVQSTLYILFDLPHEPGRHTESIMREIMEAYIKSGNPEEVEMRKRAVLTKAQERVPEVLKQLITSQAQQQTVKVRRAITNLENQITEYQGIMQHSLGKLVAEQKMLRILEAETSGETAAAKEIAALKRIKKVTRISTRQDRLIVELDTVYLTTETARYKIGKFQIEFGPEHHFRVKNTTGKIRDYDHPHVRDGEPCLGTMKDMLLYAYSGEIALAVMTTIDFLHTLTPESVYHAVDAWPEVENFKRPKTELKPELAEEVIAADTLVAMGFRSARDSGPMASPTPTEVAYGYDPDELVDPPMVLGTLAALPVSGRVETQLRDLAAQARELGIGTDWGMEIMEEENG